MKTGDTIWLLLLALVTAILIVPFTHGAFMHATNAHPYLMGFAKFAILATMGEWLTIRILKGKWMAPSGAVIKTIIWGVIGMAVVMMFSLFNQGVIGATAMGLLPKASGFMGGLLVAFFTSALMNLTFGPVFMAAHRITDTWIDQRSGQNNEGTVIDTIDWPGFIRFVVGKTIPFFWIPAHTVVFLLPPQYRVIAAAYLSIALGLILAYARRKKIN